MTVKPEDRVFSLRDGRSMGFADYGPADGFVVINAHGAMSCRYDIRAAVPFAEAAGIRLISPDRPGVGLSDPSPGRTVLDWAADVEQLVDHLGIERMGVFGRSMGGQYAAALGYALAPRVNRVAIVAGALPLTEPGVLAELDPWDRTYTRWAERRPRVVSMWFRFMASSARRTPHRFAAQAARVYGPMDAETITGNPDHYIEVANESLRNLSGAVEEYRAWARPWGFAPEDIEVPVDVWWGGDDRFVHKTWPSRLANRIPQSTLNIGSGGHLMANLHYGAILEALADAA